MTYKGDWCEVTPVGDLLVRGAHRHPHQDLIVFPGSRHTYVEVLDRAIWIARGLLALGVRRGDHVGLLAPNGIEFVEGFFGAALIGSIVVPLNARHKATELAYIIENADLKVLLTLAGTDEYVDFVDLIHDALPSLAGSTSTSRLALPEAPRLRGVVLIRGEDEAGFIGRSDFDRLAVGQTCDDVDRQRLCVRVRDTAAILYTSGTTAHPKGCMLSHEAMTRGRVDRATKRLTTDGRHISWSVGRSSISPRSHHCWGPLGQVART